LTAFWTGLVALAMVGSALPFRRWLSLLGIVSAAAILVGTLEPAGFEPAADIVVVGYILWSIWLAVFGILVLRTKPLGERATELNPITDPATPIERLAGSRS
jgi:hypothetical protein